MLKLNILNVDRFLKEVNACKGAVKMRCSDGRAVDINRDLPLQEELRVRYRRNKNFLPLVLDVPGRADYMRIVSYYAGDC